MNSLVLFVGLLAIAFSNGLISSEDERLPIHRVNRGVGDKKLSSESVYEKPVAEPSYDKPPVKPSPESPVDPYPEPYPEPSTEKPSTEVNEIVSSTPESIPKFDIDTEGYIYLNGDNGDIIITFFGEKKNYTIHENASIDYTLGENNYPVNISSIKDNNVVRINFTIVNENSTYDDYLEDIISNWYKWLQRERPRRDVGDTNPPEFIEQPTVKSHLRDLFKRINSFGKYM